MVPIDLTLSLARNRLGETMNPFVAKYTHGIIAFFLCVILCLLSLLALISFPIGEAEAATLHRGDVTRAASGGIVLDADLYTKQPTFDKTISETSEPYVTTKDTVHTYFYALRVPANTYQQLGTTITVRWNDVGFDADDDRIDLMLSWLPDSRWYATKTLSEIPLLQRFDQNSFDSAGICIGHDGTNYNYKGCCEQHIKISFFKHGTATPASGSFLTKITDLDTGGWSGGYKDRWCESIEFISGHSSDMYVPESNVLNITQNRNGEQNTDYRATQPMSGSDLNSGVLAHLSHGAEFWYYSTSGWTDILDQFDAKNIKLNSGAGGRIHCKGKTDAIAVGWRGSRTIAIEPESGYRVIDVNVDGSSVGARTTYTFSNITKDHAISATFVPISYHLSFRANGGEGVMHDQTLTYDHPSKIALNQYQRTGYLFTGWNTRPDGTGISYSNEQEISNLSAQEGATVTLFAQWKPINYYVAFDPNGGMGTMPDQQLMFDHPETLQEALFKRTGFRWVSWNTNLSVPGTTYADQALVENLAKRANEVVTLYAIWSANRCLVVYDSNGGTGTMHAQSLAYGSAEALYPNAFVREGHHWVGWNTEHDGSGTPFSDEQVVQDLNPVDNSTITLYALWEKDQPDLPSDPSADDPDSNNSGPTTDEPEPDPEEPTPLEPEPDSNDPGNLGDESGLDDGANASTQESAALPEDPNDQTGEVDQPSQQDEQDLALALDSVASFVKTGESIMPLLCLGLVLLAGGIAFLIAGRRRRKRLQARKRQLFQNFLEP